MTHGLTERICSFSSVETQPIERVLALVIGTFGSRNSGGEPWCGVCLFVELESKEGCNGKRAMVILLVIATAGAA